jgi:hypothetical protein
MSLGISIGATGIMANSLWTVEGDKAMSLPSSHIVWLPLSHVTPSEVWRIDIFLFLFANFEISHVFLGSLLILQYFDDLCTRIITKMASYTKIIINQ